MDPNWRERAACRGVDPEIFFPPKGGKGQLAGQARADAFCAACPVTEECFHDGVVNGPSRCGIRGGRGRRAVLAERKRLGVNLLERPRALAQDRVR